MNRKFHVAVLLLILFTTATVLAGYFDRGNLEVSVAASARCGTIPTSDGNVPHYFNNVVQITGAAKAHTLDARYQISWETKMGYTIYRKRATLHVSGSVYVINSSCCMVGNTDTYSYDEDVVDRFGKANTGTIDTGRTFEWSTSVGGTPTNTTDGCYTARIDGEGQASSVSGGGGSLGVGTTIKGVTLNLAGGYNTPPVERSHACWILGSDGSTKVFTHRGEDGFYVGTDTKYLSNYTPTSP